MGTVHWKRRWGCCPDRCKIGQVAPMDQERGLKLPQFNIQDTENTEIEKYKKLRALRVSLW